MLMLPSLQMYLKINRFIYDHFKRVTDVTTYCVITYHNVFTNIKDIGIAFPVCFTCDLDGYKYFWELTIYPKEYTAHCF